MLDIAIADAFANFSDGLSRIPEERASLFHADARQVFRKALAGFFFKQRAEIVDAKADSVAYLLQRNRF